MGAEAQDGEATTPEIQGYSNQGQPSSDVFSWLKEAPSITRMTSIQLEDIVGQTTPYRAS